MNRLAGIFLFILLSSFMMACNPGAEKLSALRYPETEKADSVDTYFGEEVPDPYRWLEDDRSSETASWVKAQNEVTFSYLEGIPYREKIKDRLEKLYNYERLSAPSK